jgi:hypothetical protein
MNSRNKPTLFTDTPSLGRVVGLSEKWFQFSSPKGELSFSFLLLNDFPDTHH